MRADALGQGMSDTTKDMPSVIDRTTRFAAGTGIAAIHDLAGVPVYVLDAEAVLIGDGAGRRIDLDTGALLSSAANPQRVVIGTDDGRVLALEAGSDPQVLATDPKRRWIDQVALGPDGALAFSAGKAAHVRLKTGKTHSLDLPSAAGGLAFAPKGLRLAIARYNGATLWYPDTTTRPDELDWKGSHLGILWSPDAKFIVTTMQEPQLHGWRVADGAHMRMSGYPGRVKSFAFSSDGKWLASSGADMAILWPYQSKDGPMGKQPKMLAPYDKRITRIACHPRQDVIAVGFEDGLMLMVRIGDGAEILARKPDKVAISAIAWVNDGKTLAYGTETGEAGRIDL
jgi:WD40 repeat protein